MKALTVTAHVTHTDRTYWGVFNKMVTRTAIQMVSIRNLTFPPLNYTMWDAYTHARMHRHKQP